METYFKASDAPPDYAGQHVEALAFLRTSNGAGLAAWTPKQERQRKKA